MGLLLEILTKHRQLGQTTKLIRNIYIVCTLYVQSHTEQWRRRHRCSNFENFPQQLTQQGRQGGALLLSWETTIANRERCSDTYMEYLAHDRLSKILIRLLSDSTTEVEFVHPVSAGGSGNFLPVV